MRYIALLLITIFLFIGCAPVEKDTSKPESKPESVASSKTESKPESVLSSKVESKPESVASSKVESAVSSQPEKEYSEAATKAAERRKFRLDGSSFLGGFYACKTAVTEEDWSLVKEEAGENRTEYTLNRNGSTIPIEIFLISESPDLDQTWKYMQLLDEKDPEGGMKEVEIARSPADRLVVFTLDETVMDGAYVYVRQLFKQGDTREKIPTGGFLYEGSVDAGEELAMLCQPGRYVYDIILGTNAKYAVVTFWEEDGVLKVTGPVKDSRVEIPYKISTYDQM